MQSFKQTFGGECLQDKINL